jgi:hypothetical protein
VLARLCAKKEFWTPDQPADVTAMTRPTSADPPLPNPVQRASSVVERPSRTPVIPVKMATTSRMTEPRVMARTARPKDIPLPGVAPIKTWVGVDSWAKRWTTMIRHEYLAWPGTRSSE